jgi:mono/diheme cytochrome c family protein
MALFYPSKLLINIDQMKTGKIRASLYMLATSALLMSCGGNSTPAEGDKQPLLNAEEPKTETAQPAAVNTSEYSDSKGIGPITSITLADINADLAKSGEEVFQNMCTACHKMDKRYVGPALGGITKRRTPEWVLNMMLNPEGMTAEDPIAKALLEEYISPMANQNLTEDQAKSVLEYFRQYDAQNS